MSSSGDYFGLSREPEESAFDSTIEASAGDDEDIHDAELAALRRQKEHFTLDESDSPTNRPSVLREVRYYPFPRAFLRSMHTYAANTSRRRSLCYPKTIFESQRALKCILYFITVGFSIIGFLSVAENTFHALATIPQDGIERNLLHWGGVGEVPESFVHWPTDATADTSPIHCSSHNDYWRQLPLYSAIAAGCSSVEADVWLVENELHVGHRRVSLTTDRTLRNLYFDPLLRLLEAQNPPARFRPDEDYPLDPDETSPLNGIFDTEPTRSFVLLLDFKSSGPALWWQLQFQLFPLREKGYLTHFNGTNIVERPITVVATGNAPFEHLIANETYRDVFFDAPLDGLADLSEVWPNPNRAQDPTRRHGRQVYGRAGTPPRPQSSAKATTSRPMERDPGQSGSSTSGNENENTYDQFNSFYASVSFTKSIGRIWGSRLGPKQLQLIRAQVRGAHQRGLRVRYWDVPQWPVGLRNHIWHILVREGVDILNVDDLYGATRTDWRKTRRVVSEWPRTPNQDYTGPKVA